jgi:hypothetical protein
MRASRRRGSNCHDEANNSASRPWTDKFESCPITPEIAMRIKQHDRSHIVELSDGSAWRIWPGDTAGTLRWLSTTEIDVADIEDEICSHALINRSDGSRVRVIKASADWPVSAVRRSLGEG